MFMLRANFFLNRYKKILIFCNNINNNKNKTYYEIIYYEKKKIYLLL